MIPNNHQIICAFLSELVLTQYLYKFITKMRTLLENLTSTHRQEKPPTCLAREHVCKAKYAIKAHKNYFKTSSRASNTFYRFYRLSYGLGICMNLLSLSS